MHEKPVGVTYFPKLSYCKVLKMKCGQIPVVLHARVSTQHNFCYMVKVYMDMVNNAALFPS